MFILISSQLATSRQYRLCPVHSDLEVVEP